MVNSDKLRFVCTRCGNCCTDRNTLVNVTFLDILRIIKSLKLEFSELFEIFGFYVYDKALTSTILEKMVVTPVETERGLAFIGLVKNDQGICCSTNEETASCQVDAIVSMDGRGQIILRKEVREKANMKTFDKFAVITCEMDGKVCCVALVKTDRFVETAKDILGPLFRRAAED